MILRCGLVGLPNVGKSTLFNAITRTQKANAANFPFCTIEPNLGIIPVPDKRLDQLGELVKPEKVTPNFLEVVDIAGLIKGAAKGEGLGNQFLAHIREVDAIIQVIRCFEDPQIIHVAGKVDPKFDKEVIQEELQAKDLLTIENHILKIQKLVKIGSKEAQQNLRILEAFQKTLQEGKNIYTVALSQEEKNVLKQLQLLTSKPTIYVVNVSEESIQNPTENKMLQEFQNSLEEGAICIPICIGLEEQLALMTLEESTEMLSSYRLKETGIANLMKESFKMLSLISYFTAGKQEVRAWAIPKNTKAPKAAAEIHTDFEKKFIKAEVIKFQDFMTYQTEQACRAAGKVNLEGKDYLVQDGDVMHFKCNS